MCKLCKDDIGFKKELILLETEHCFVMANFFPIGEYSFLIVTKRHLESIVDTTKEESNEIMDLQKMLINRIRSVAGRDINCFLNEGEIAGQSIPHVHYHVVARSENDGLENFKRSTLPYTIEPAELTKHKDLFT